VMHAAPIKFFLRYYDFLIKENKSARATHTQYPRKAGNAADAARWAADGLSTGAHDLELVDGAADGNAGRIAA
jgi:hypothetical protein